MTLTATYADIKEIIKDEEKKRDPQPFKVGEQFTAVSRDYSNGFQNAKEIRTIYEIVKASDTTIQLKPADTDKKPITRKPSQRFNGQWAFSIDDAYDNTFYKYSERSIKNEKIQFNGV